jgi:hypothetical protein
MDMGGAKWVRIMADYCAEPLWGPDGTMQYLDELPISADLRARLAAWEDWFDLHSLDNPDFDRAAFSQAGLELACDVKAQLPDWTVIYFDEAAANGRSPDAPRETFEYEVTA